MVEEWLLALEVVSDAVALCSGAVLLRCNRAFASLFSADASALRGARLEDLIADHFTPIANIAKKEPTASHERSTARLQYRDGRRFESERYSMNKRERPLEIVILRDVSSQVRAERQTAALANAESSAILSSGIWHELKSPVQGLNGALALIAASATSEPGDQLAVSRDIFGLMQESLGRMSFVLDGLRAVFSGEPLDKKTITVASFISDFLRVGEVEARRRNIAVVTTLAPGLTVAADPRALYQIFLNLFANAINALENARDERRITIRSRATDTHVLLAIEDTGHGMSTRAREQAFRPFESLRANGTGLGLYFVGKLVAALGGEIAIADTASGTCFELRFALPVTA